MQKTSQCTPQELAIICGVNLIVLAIHFCAETAPYSTSHCSLSRQTHTQIVTYFRTRVVPKLGLPHEHDIVPTISLSAKWGPKHMRFLFEMQYEMLDKHRFVNFHGSLAKRQHSILESVLSHRVRHTQITYSFPKILVLGERISF